MKVKYEIVVSDDWNGGHGLAPHLICRTVKDEEDEE